MDYSYIFRSAKINKDSLKAAGFTTSDDNNYVMQMPVSNGAFNAEISLSLSEQTLTVQLFDSATGEKYALFDMPSHGAFVASLREEVQKIIDDIKSKCFETNDLKDDFIAWIKSKFGAEPDYPWPDDAPYSFVFRCPNEKWFALVMRIKYRQLGLTGDDYVWVVNMKANQDSIPNLVDHKSIFPAWHMNKKYWITILLTAVTDFEKLCELTEKSYELVTR
ncbi:Predicted DNA-binding protein, MmcQ/YjbR family [Treponema bryantii]|uniref:Predicted DNA-binding protein, MmcQ/YjbR family n=1 Tax=Treponema bryantii TaxID=163 RepID=A0A1I3J8I6_9SPIR|nr:MmcQ/YjbR family DNA-binding protein [Treponema bryantii]SFI56185.1 Predicted DNA-binding protein, MmcQ/YjbR family [Treponema bryantii]